MNTQWLTYFAEVYLVPLVAALMGAPNTMMAALIVLLVVAILLHSGTDPHQPA